MDGNTTKEIKVMRRDENLFFSETSQSWVAEVLEVDWYGRNRWFVVGYFGSRQAAVEALVKLRSK
jgi:hypothetical protein